MLIELCTAMHGARSEVLRQGQLLIACRFVICVLLFADSAIKK